MFSYRLLSPLLYFLFLFLWFSSEGTNATKDDFDVELEPGHVKQEYDSVEEVRGHDNDTVTEKPAEDEHLMREAILDVAYYLRRFKFSGHDPRYLAEGEIPKQNLFLEFPSPPLRNIHWEVKKNCEPSFLECVRYLQEQISQTPLPRHLDSLTIARQNGWSLVTDKDLIQTADIECHRHLEKDEKTFNFFSGPLQRFQWLTSASYYMCLYTMKEVSYLRNFTEDCDNLAMCMDWNAGLNNLDIRADNTQPFACASYSFCPDPCCPLKFLADWRHCLPESPCFGSSNTTCTLHRKENIDFESLMLNNWNVSCDCDEPGMRWESKSGMCVDVDECIESPCNYPEETCRNLPGTYKCACSPLGYERNERKNTCEPDPILRDVFYPQNFLGEKQNISISTRMSRKFQNAATKVKHFMSETFKRRPNLTGLF